ncbi:DUF1656 domain-containing protein [Salinisphaera sp. USBA-960]|uniref:DUF1656 domain-containing protein n=1 Tax=Salinisphaera orenii TaxID=856731 RepID=UPI000DBE3733|nr:DUF1656 domain-containing protein [Salifodinibacter halophilus]NNC26732.1 DUF1656 domain-containing protein [Salifodinibacter halophilus]
MQLEQIEIGGVYLPVLLICLAGAAVVYFCLRGLLSRIWVYRAFWHPALAGAAVYAVIAAALILWLVP